MNGELLHSALKNYIPDELARDLVVSFLGLRRDVILQVFGGSSAGKFVETFCQILQYLESGSFEEKPNVDTCLRAADSLFASVDDGLRICGARMARSMYALRNKRNIAHKGDVDPNTYDLSYLLAGSQWITSELVRHAMNTSMTDAGTIVDSINVPVGGLVEDFGEKRIAYGNLNIREEILVLLHASYPNSVSASDLFACMDRRNLGSIRNEVLKMWQDKLLEKSESSKYALTRKGHASASDVLIRESS